LVQALHSGDLADVSDNLLGHNQAEAIRQVHGGRASGRFFLFRSHSNSTGGQAPPGLDQPISCMKGVERINNALDAASKELAVGVPLEHAQDFFNRDVPILFSEINSVCGIPKEILTEYPLLYEMADQAWLQLSFLLKELLIHP